MTWEAARKWVEEHLEADEYEAEFGVVSEDDSAEILSLSLPSATAAKARRAAAQEGITLSQWIANLIK